MNIDSRDAGSNTERCTHGGDCLIHPDAQGLHDYGTQDLRAEVDRLRVEVSRLRGYNTWSRAVAEAAEYKYGDMLCLEGECEHIDEDVPCQMVETRYATAAELLAVQSLLMSTDMVPLGDDEEIPVGEIRRVLAEALEAAEASAAAGVTA